MQAIDTARVQGRRQLRFATMDDMLGDAEKLASSPNVKMLGNRPLNELLTHLAMAINSSIDGFAGLAPWYIRLLGPFIKRRILVKGMSPGFNLPKSVEPDFFPAAPSPQAALETLRTAVNRTRTKTMSARHPVLGRLTHDEWTQLHLRHAEMHLGFALPIE